MHFVSVSIQFSEWRYEVKVAYDLPNMVHYKLLLSKTSISSVYS